ncbi:TonB-dependent receptor plug domain-containing protein [Kiritimatiella glycovorans]|uniref:Outer membrane receptor for ferrienterochelin and colicins n=1 Tax=Kiritimatiella glycovorans TaxID=1307763 RepID=A0A0G3EHT4_9BACT|nr:Plug domain-containing protein [Kiritimatiella glycovorans]AKJ64360.1 Outer membrane receptor for ferrienterochelin and colicins [Kiritimatiella glycovorans]
MNAWKTAAGIAVLTAAGALPAAETNTTETAAREVVVTARRVESDIRTEPRNAIVIDGGDLRARGYSSLDQVLEKEAGVTFHAFGESPALQRPNMRGFGGDAPHQKILILLTAVR